MRAELLVRRLEHTSPFLAFRGKKISLWNFCALTGARDTFERCRYEHIAVYDFRTRRIEVHKSIRSFQVYSGVQRNPLEELPFADRNMPIRGRGNSNAKEYSEAEQLILRRFLLNLRYPIIPTVRRMLNYGTPSPTVSRSRTASINKENPVLRSAFKNGAVKHPSCKKALLRELDPNTGDERKRVRILSPRSECIIRAPSVEFPSFSLDASATGTGNTSYGSEDLESSAVNDSYSGAFVVYEDTVANTSTASSGSGSPWSYANQSASSVGDASEERTVPPTPGATPYKPLGRRSNASSSYYMGSDRNGPFRAQLFLRAGV